MLHMSVGAAFFIWMKKITHEHQQQRVGLLSAKSDYLSEAQKYYLKQSKVDNSMCSPF